MTDAGHDAGACFPEADLDREIAAAFDPRRMFDYPDPYPLFAAMRRRAPLVPVDLAGRRVFALTTHDEARAVLGDPVTFVQPSIARVVFGESRRTRATRHAHARGVAARLFTASAVAPLAGRIAAIAHRLLDRLGPASRTDLFAGYARTLPMLVLAELIGVPADDHEQFLGWSHDIIGLGRDPARGMRAAQAMDRYLAPIVRARRLDPRDDLVSRLAVGSAQGEGLSEAEVVGFLRVLIPAGADPPAQMLGSLLVALLTEPARLERVRGDRTLVRWAIVEALRWEAPIVYVLRRAAHPVVLTGIAVPPNTDICVVVGSANRDERRYPDPDRYDIDRRADDHLSFSYGRHYCMGSHLAALLGEIALDVVLDRLPRLRLDPDAPPPAIVGFAFRQPARLLVRLD